MPYQELGYSEKDITFDADGYATLMRVFKVWDVNPRVFFGTIANVTHYQTFTPLPEIGSVLQVVSGPKGLFGTDTDESVKTNLRLIRYTLRPVSHIVFEAIAHYSNDPREAPLGQAYHCDSQFTIVQIPYVRYVPSIWVGATGTTPPDTIYNSIESSLGVPMSVKRISQTVTVKRAKRKMVEEVALARVGQLHQLWPNHVCRFEGYDIRLRSPQWMDITYNWVWEAGILGADAFGEFVIDYGNQAPPAQAPLKAAYPYGHPPVFAALGNTVFLLPPYHTIEMGIRQVANAPEIANKKPYWIYRCNHPPEFDKWKDLVGHEQFEWWEP